MALRKRRRGRRHRMPKRRFRLKGHCKFRRGGHAKYRLRGGHRPISLVGKNANINARIVLKTSMQSDWVATPFANTGAIFVNAINMLGCHQPLVGLPTGPTNSYTGLNTYLTNVDTNAAPYRSYRVVWSRCTVTWVNATFPVNSLRVVICPDPVIGGGVMTTAANMLTLSSQPLAKEALVINQPAFPTKLSVAVSPRRLMGLTQGNFSQDKFYGQALVNPAAVLNWVIAAQPMISASEASSTYVYRVKIDALIEINNRWGQPLYTA